MKKLLSNIILFFITLFGKKKKYLLDSNNKFILDSNYKPIKAE